MLETTIPVADKIYLNTGSSNFTYFYLLTDGRINNNEARFYYLF